MKLAEQIASKLHEDWRKTRLTETGVYEPRWKKVKDESFILKLDLENLPANVRINEGVVEIDIANSTYQQLSADWQAENKAAAEVVAEVLESDKDYSIDEVGEIIHTEWLKRNDWAKGGELDVPFVDLPKNEQNKDLAQYYIGIETMEQILDAEIQQTLPGLKNKNTNPEMRK